MDWTPFIVLVAVFAVSSWIGIYSLARSKGYNGFLVVSLALIPPVLLTWILLETRNPRWVPIVLVIPIGIMVILRAAPPRPDAPRLHIYFECPHCHQMISLPRERRGLTSWCPRCTEILTVPSTSASDEPPEAQRVEPDVPPETERKKPDIREGLLVFATCADESEAECLASVLEDGGVRAGVQTESSSSVLPPVIAATAHVVIDVADWERAVEIERSWREGEPPPPDRPSVWV